MISPRPISPTMINTIPTPTLKSASSSIRKEQKKKVRFAPLEETSDSIHPPPMKELTLDIINDVWFTEEEIYNFKRTAKQIVYSGQVPEGETLCGLERYRDIRRSKYKRAAIYYILQAAGADSTPVKPTEQEQHSEFVCAVSKRCTAWARHIARTQGMEHYFEVYGEKEEDPLDDLFANFDDYFDATTTTTTSTDNKRAMGQQEEEDIEPLPFKRQKLSAS